MMSPVQAIIGLMDSMSTAISIEQQSPKISEKQLNNVTLFNLFSSYIRLEGAQVQG